MGDVGERPERTRNQLLQRLGEPETRNLIAKMQRVPILAGQSLTDDETPADRVYFPESAVASVLVRMRDGTTIEVGTVGSEGVVGLPVFLGAPSHRFGVIGQISGEALRMDAAQFRREVDASERLHDILHIYTQAFLAQLARRWPATAAIQSRREPRAGCSRRRIAWATASSSSPRSSSR